MSDLIAWLDEERGRRKALCLHLGIGQSNLSQWREVPPKLVLKIEAFTSISRYRLAPEVFGTAPEVTP